MPQQKYAIRCSTEEQARECREQGFVALLNEYSNMYDSEDYNKITYDEAISLGLFGEKKCSHNFVETFGNAGSICSRCGKKFTGLTQEGAIFSSNSVSTNPQKAEPVNESHSEDKEVGTPYMDYLERKESPSEDIVDKIMEEIIELLPDNYSCTRVWGAWQYGTMGESDFIPLRENEEFIEDMRSIIKKHLSSK